MSFNIQNHVYTSDNINTDRQRARAERFVNRSDNELSRMAYRAYSIKNHDRDEKFISKTNVAFISLPAISLASNLILGNGIKKAAKHSAFWGAALLAPEVVKGIGKAVSKPDSNGKKQNKIPYGLSLALSFGAMFAGQIGIQKLAENKKVNKIADTLITGVKTTYNKLKKDIKLPKKIVNKYTQISNSIKTPEFIKPTVDFIKTNGIIQSVKDSAINIAKKGVKHAPTIVIIGTVASIIHHGFKINHDISSTKSELKEAQLDTARILIDSYKQENQALKS